MADKEEEVIDSQDDKEIETPETNETTLTVDDYNRVVAERDAEREKNKKLYARVQKSKDTQPLAEKRDEGINPTEFTKLKLKVDHGITDPEALDFILKNGGEKALENPYIKKTLDSMLEQKRAENATIDNESGRSEFEKKFSTEELKTKSSEELEKILPHA